MPAKEGRKLQISFFFLLAEISIYLRSRFVWPSWSVWPAAPISRPRPWEVAHPQPWDFWLLRRELRWEREAFPRQHVNCPHLPQDLQSTKNQNFFFTNFHFSKLYNMYRRMDRRIRICATTSTIICTRLTCVIKATSHGYSLLISLCKSLGLLFL